MNKPIHNGRVTDNGKAPRRPVPKPGDRAGNAEVVAVDEPMHTPPELVGPRECDLKGCTSKGAAAVEIKVNAYTGNPEDRLTLVVCKDHAGQYESNAIVGFAWTPVYAHEIPAHLRPSPVRRDEPQA